METVDQTLEEILTTLMPLNVEWADAISVSVVEQLRAFPTRAIYSTDDITSILDRNFDEGILICRLFLALSKDSFQSAFLEARGDAGTGVKAYRADPEQFVRDLDGLGLTEAMAEAVNAAPHWSDVLVERLRSGRGSAIAGQRRGRDVEDFVEEVVARVFGTSYEKRCTFIGKLYNTAKCDFAIPSKISPRIVIEAKGYAATGSKMTDVLGDINKIIDSKRADTAFLFFTDGLTWRQRKSDLAKIVQAQNTGDIMRIYTRAMTEQFEADLRQLKTESGL